MANIFVGSDCEAFLKKDGIITSVFDLLPGSKAEPHWFSKNEAIQPDGTSAEWNVAPSKSFAEFNASIDRCMNTVLEYLPEGFEFSTQASHVYSPEEIATMNPEALIMGCSEDYNALTGVVNPAPTPAEGLRSAGGHVWMDCPVGDLEQRFLIIAADYFLGLPSLLECTDTRRREIYGKASAYRPSKVPYVEYRTLSNYWTFDVKYRKAVFERAQKTAGYHSEEMFDALTAIIEPTDVAECINDGNKEVAKEMIQILKDHGL